MLETAATAHPGRASLPALDRVAIATWLLTLIAGTWSLTRFDLAFASWGFLAEIRYWLGAVFLGLAAVTVATAPRAPRRLGRAWWWLLSVIALHVYLAVSIAWTPEPAQATPIVPGLLLIAALLVVTPALYRRRVEEALDFLFWLQFWIVLAYVVGGMSGRWEENGRMAAFGGGANVFARIMGMGLIASGYLWASSNQVRWLWATPFFAYGAVMSGSRGGLLAVGLAGGAFLLYLRSRAPLRLRTIGPVILSTLFLFVIQGDRIMEVWRWRFVELTIQQAYGSERSQIFSDALRLFADHPIAGVGLDGFRLMGSSPYPHNIVLHVLAEGGILAGALLAAAGVLLVGQIWQRSTLAQGAVLACAGLYFVASMFSGGLYDARFVWLYALLYMLPQASVDDSLRNPGRRPSAGPGFRAVT